MTGFHLTRKIMHSYNPISCFLVCVCVWVGAQLTNSALHFFKTFLHLISISELKSRQKNLLTKHVYACLNPR